MALKMAGPPPYIPAGYDFVLESFRRLSTERPVVEGMIMFIPIMKIIEYVQWMGMTDVSRITSYIHAMDAHFVTLQNNNLRKKHAASARK